ncbi:hypothetical protein chiPu_0024817 [Chiloscyllium punctatum]|uniref:Uncharacterized protein n=1 Tax=Chiloscyllium punctatum TaxID=137246 RepID=A0A401TD99_CHIPU|nr:hypothetical protein [Chiloscyllium punctatum]
MQQHFGTELAYPARAAGRAAVYSQLEPEVNEVVGPQTPRRRTAPGTSLTCPAEVAFCRNRHSQGSNKRHGNHIRMLSKLM